MKIIKLIALIGLLFISAISWAGDKPILNIQHWTASTGAKVYFVRAPELPMMTVQLAFAAGSAYDGTTFGLANLTNVMLGEESQTLNSNQVANAFDSVGAQMSTDTGADMAVVSLRSLTDPKYLTPALNTFTDLLSHPKFDDPKTLRRIKNSIIASIKAGQQRPTAIAAQAFFKAAFANTPYAHPINGSINLVNQYTAQQIMQFYKHYYSAKNADVIIVGDLTKKQAKKIANQVTQGLPKGEAIPRFHVTPMLKKSQTIHINFPAKQTTVILGQVGIRRQSPYYFPLLVGDAVFGGGGLTSILYQQLRVKRGLVYYVSTGFRPLQYRGSYMISFQTKADQAKKAIQVVRNNLIEYRKDGPTAKQLKMMKQNLIGRFPLGLSSNRNIVTVLTLIAFYHRPLNYLDMYKVHVSKVTASQIRKAFNAVIHPNKMVLVTVGPKAPSSTVKKPSDSALQKQ